MTAQPQPSYAFHCPYCSTYLKIANPRPQEVAALILLDESDWRSCGSRICHQALVECTECGCQLYVLLLYASEEVLQELDIDRMPPF